MDPERPGILPTISGNYLLALAFRVRFFCQVFAALHLACIIVRLLCNVFRRNEDEGGR